MSAPRIVDAPKKTSPVAHAAIAPVAPHPDPRGLGWSWILAATAAMAGGLAATLIGRAFA